MTNFPKTMLLLREPFLTMFLNYQKLSIARYQLPIVSSAFKQLNDVTIILVKNMEGLQRRRKLQFYYANLRDKSSTKKKHPVIALCS